MVSIEEVYSQGFIQREYFQTQVEILKSDELARKVIQKLKLTTHPDFDPRQAEPGFWRQVHAVCSSRKSSAPTEDAILKRVTRKFKRTSRSSSCGTATSRRSASPRTTRNWPPRCPNAMAELFIESDLEARVAMTQKATDWLRERMGELRGKVDTAEKNLQDYRDRERIVDAKGLAMSGASKQLEELTRSLVEARAKRAEAEAAYSLVQQVQAGKIKTTYDTIPARPSPPAGAEDEGERGRGRAAPGRSRQALRPRAPQHDQGAGGAGWPRARTPGARSRAW